MSHGYKAPVKPAVCVVGPMLGRNPGYVTTQGEILSDKLEANGYPVFCVSSRRNRYHRLGDILLTILRNRRRIDLLLLQMYSGPSFVVEDLASHLAVRLGIPILMHVHGGAMPSFMSRYPKWTQRVLRRAQVIVTPSDYLARAVEEHGFQARIIPNIIDVGVYPYRLRRSVRPRLFWMRTFHPIYNPLMALRVLERLRATQPDASLVMAGQDKGIQQDVEGEARKLGLDGAVRFPGFLDPKAKVREGAAAELFINTTRVDNQPVAVIEACAMGLPVIATKVGGVEDLLSDGVTGLLVPDDDDEAMADAVCRLVNDPELCGRLSEAGRELAKRSAWEGLMPAWAGAIDGALQAHKPPGGSRH